MLTVKELKAELDAMGVDYPHDALKAELEDLLEDSDVAIVEEAKEIFDKEEDPPQNTFERLSQKKGNTPDYYTDPNAHPDTQAK